MPVLWIMDIEDVQYTMNRKKRPVCPLYKQIRTPSLHPLEDWSAGTNRCLISKLLTTFSKDQPLYSTIRNSPCFLRILERLLDFRWPILSRTVSDGMHLGFFLIRGSASLTVLVRYGRETSRMQTLLRKAKDFRSKCHFREVLQKMDPLHLKWCLFVPN
jgi:hypothetical protein